MHQEPDEAGGRAYMVDFRPVSRPLTHTGDVEHHPTVYQLAVRGAPVDDIFDRAPSRAARLIQLQRAHKKDGNDDVPKVKPARTRRLGGATAPCHRSRRVLNEQFTTRAQATYEHCAFKGLTRCGLGGEACGSDANRVPGRQRSTGGLGGAARGQGSGTGRSHGPSSR